MRPNPVQSNSKVAVPRQEAWWRLVPIVLVTAALVCGLIVVITRPPDNGVGFLQLFFVGGPSLILVTVLRRWVWVAWPVAMILSANIYIVLEYSPIGSMFWPFLIVFCGGWWHQQKEKGRNPWMGVLLAGFFCLIAVLYIPVEIFMKSDFYHDIERTDLTRVVVSRPDGRSISVSDPVLLERIHHSLKETYPYHRNHESWRHDYSITLHGTDDITIRRLDAKLGNNATSRSLWIEATEGEFQNAALYAVLLENDVFQAADTAKPRQ